MIGFIAFSELRVHETLTQQDKKERDKIHKSRLGELYLSQSAFSGRKYKTYIKKQNRLV
jgi:hypothetical protein